VSDWIEPVRSLWATASKFCLFHKSWTISPLPTDTDTISGNSKSTLEELDFFKEGFVEKDNPSKLLDLFLLVRDVEHIRWEGFVGYKTTEESNINQRNGAAHDCDQHLAKRASCLLRKCDDPDRENNTESGRVATFTTEVFHRFH
jgi:hypothetical protein